MFQSLAIFRTAQAMAQHAGARQAVTARNVANADTPDYRARHISTFEESFRLARTPAMHVTRPSHMQSAPGVATASETDAGTEPNPNGNTVSLEDEMMNAINISREHNRALAIYRHGMTILRTSLGR